jgi:dedicated sortase system histidine kinase
MKHHTSFFRSLRFKLLLASFTLGLIPIAGYHYLQGMEQMLREAQERLLLNRAEIIAGMLSAESSEFLPPPPTQPNSMKSLYAFPLETPPVIDGYADDWIDLKPQAERFNARSNSAQAVGFEWLAGFHEDELYLLIEVFDEHLIYPQNEREITAGDHLILALPGDDGQTRQLLIGTPAPGWLHGKEAGRYRTLPRISGEWQETGHGYRVELRLPTSWTAERISVVAIDIDQAGGQPVGIASTSGWQRNEHLAYLTRPIPKAKALLQRQADKGFRYTLLNRQRQVLGRHGRLSETIHTGDNLLQRLATLLLADETPRPFSHRKKLGRLDGPEIRQALSGSAGVYRYQSPHSDLFMLSSAHPIHNNGAVQGVLVVEQSTQEILIAQQSATEDLLLISLGLFVITGGSLLLLASSITRRITRLSRKYQQAVSHDGRVLKAITTPAQTDELSQLDANLSSVLKRTQDYSHYLESMASRLAHEFRTPLTVIQSSLENLQAEITATHEQGEMQSAALTYASRAQEGARRLNQILTRLREATRLEQSLQDAEITDIDLTELIRALTLGYADSYREATFLQKLPKQSITCPLSPDLVSQAMDKLISNAVDFHRPGTPISIELIRNDMDSATLKVINQGPQIDDATRQCLFRSMGSRRPSNDQQPHLGLGLYLVRLIAEFHQGKAWVENQDDGVCFAVKFPSLPSQ